jgi:glycosyltransferase involved in cell wall biosynthesis
MHTPRVSVVIPTFNSEAFLVNTVQSIRAQTFEHWELVLSDDGSSDGTPEMAKELAKGDSRIHVVLGHHGGIAEARNGGFRATDPQSAYIAFLDHDDTWEPDALTVLVGALDAHPECAGAHGLARSIDGEGRQFEGDDLMERMRHRREIRNGQYVELPARALTSFEAELVENYIVTPGTSLVRRCVLESLGGFEPATIPCDDWDMNLRIARYGGFALVDQVILNWRRHPGNASAASRRWRQAYLLVRKRAIQSVENTAQQRQAAVFALLNQCRQMRLEAGQELMRGQLQCAARSFIRVMLFYAAYYQSVRSVRRGPSAFSG